jgi:hypothetical protein
MNIQVLISHVMNRRHALMTINCKHAMLMNGSFAFCIYAYSKYTLNAKHDRAFSVLFESVLPHHVMTASSVAMRRPVLQCPC